MNLLAQKNTVVRLTNGKCIVISTDELINYCQKNKELVNWENLSSEGFLSENFIREFKDIVSWKKVSRNQTLSESFIEEFQHDVDWRFISIYQQLTESFICKHKLLVDWYYISRDQKLSEGFIREFEDFVYWFNIASYQTLSEEFIREFESVLNRDVNKGAIEEWQDITYSFAKELGLDIDAILSDNQNLSPASLKSYKKYIQLKELFTHNPIRKEG